MLTISIGDRFHHWTVIGLYITKANRVRSWLCACDCGTERYVDQGALIYGKSTNCGCSRVVSAETKELLRERSTGQTRSQEARDKISRANKGKKRPDGWTPWTPERRARQDAKNLAKGASK